MTRKRVLAVLLVGIAVACISVSAQQGMQDPLLSHMTGTWVLHGTIAGKETTHDVTAEWVLNREYIQPHEVSREKDGQGRAAYEALVSLGWDDKLKQYAGLWLDTTGGGGLAPWAIGHGKTQRQRDRMVVRWRGWQHHPHHLCL